MITNNWNCGDSYDDLSIFYHKTPKTINSALDLRQKQQETETKTETDGDATASTAIEKFVKKSCEIVELSFQSKMTL